MKTHIYSGQTFGPEKYKQIGAALQKGCIAAFPTDTVYGLGAVYSNEEAVRKIFKAKGRDEGKPLSVLISSMDQVDLLAAGVPSEAHILMEKFWPGPLTLILKKKEGIPDEVTAGGETVGIRMPANEIALNIIKAAGSPLAAPSANISGKRSAVCIEDVLEDLDGKIDIAVDGGPAQIGVSSTILEVSEMRIIRQGSITPEMIGDALRESKNFPK